MIINQSKINHFWLCPESFKRLYLIGDRCPSGVAAKIGTGLHKGAEVNFKAKVETFRDEPLDVVLDAAAEGYDRSIIDEGVYFPPNEKSTAKKQIYEGKDTTVELAKLFHRELAPRVQPLFVEKKVIIQTDIATYSGIIDEYDGKWLMDMKTAASRWSKQKVEADIQLTLYSKLIAEDTGKWPERCSIENFVKNKTPVHQSETTYRSESDFMLLESRVETMLRMINAGIFPPCDPTHWKCSPKYCGYWWSCKYVPEHKKNTGV